MYKTIPEPATWKCILRYGFFNTKNVKPVWKNDSGQENSKMGKQIFMTKHGVGGLRYYDRLVEEVNDICGKHDLQQECFMKSFHTF